MMEKRKEKLEREAPRHSSGDREKFKGVQHELKRTLKQAKVGNKFKVERKLQHNNTREVWSRKGTITGYSKKNSQQMAGDVDEHRANEFNRTGFTLHLVSALPLWIQTSRSPPTPGPVSPPPSSSSLTLLQTCVYNRRGEGRDKEVASWEGSQPGWCVSVTTQGLFKTTGWAPPEDCSGKIHRPVSKVVEIPLTRCLTAVTLSTWQDGTLIWRCFSSNWYSGRTDTDDDLLSFISFLSYIMSYETPLCISSGFCGAASSILSTRACCVNSAELTIKKTQRQLQCGNFIISNLKMNFHHRIFNLSLVLWKTPCLVLVLKVGRPSEISDYSSVELAIHIIKTLERLLLYLLRSWTCSPTDDLLQFAYQEHAHTNVSMKSWKNNQ